MTPQQLLSGAQCIDSCVPAGLRQSALIALFGQIAGVTDPTAIIEAAKCVDCQIPPGMRQSAMVSLLNSILSNCGGGTPCTYQDFLIDWEPQNIVLGEKFFLGGYGLFTGLTSLVFRQTTFDDGFELQTSDAPDLVSISFPNLVSVDPNNYNFGQLQFQVLTNVTTLLLPKLQTVRGNFNIFKLGIASLALPDFIQSNQLTIQQCSALTSLSLPSMIIPNGQNLLLITNALDQTSVDNALIQCAANPAYVSGHVRLEGGTNATPGPAGLAAKADLVGRGVIVTNN